MLPCAVKAAPSLPTKADTLNLYVSTRGRDTWSGRLPTPNKRGTDGPLATPAAARDRLRQLRRQSGAQRRPVVIVLRGGTYRLTEPLIFSPEDSGTNDAPVTYTAYQGENPIVSGARPITGWRAQPDGVWTARVPEAKSGQWIFRQLFVNGARRPRTSLPKGGGFFTIAATLPPTKPNFGSDRFQFHPGDIQLNWRNLNDVEALCYHNWNMSRLRIASVEETQHVVTFTGATLSTDSWDGLIGGNRFRLENVFEALADEPGAWYLDYRMGIVYYHPLPGEKLASFHAVAPRLQQLVIFAGDAAHKRWVSDIHLRGLSFQGTDWSLGPQGYDCPQAEVFLGAAIIAEGARDCRIENCEVTHVGTYAIELGRGCKRNVIAGNILHDLGAGGVKIGEQGIRQDADDVASDNIVRDNQIFNGGQVHPAAVGVWIGQSPGNHVVHNDIHDLYYTGVSVGWTWGYNQALAQRNLIADNRIYNIGRGLLSDMGGIYTLGNQQGSVLTRNVIHDVQTFSYGGWGIYFDEGTTGIVATDNLAYHTKSGGFHQHYGKDNLVRNNIFAFSKDAQLQRTRAEDHLSFKFERNIVLWDSGTLLFGNWSQGQFLMDDNLYFRQHNAPLDFAGKSWTDWQKAGHDAHSLIADPKFVNADALNFQLKPGSPAFSLGFHPFDVSGAGARRAK